MQLDQTLSAQYDRLAPLVRACQVANAFASFPVDAVADVNPYALRRTDGAVFNFERRPFAGPKHAAQTRRNLNADARRCRVALVFDFSSPGWNGAQQGDCEHDQERRVALVLIRR